MVFEHLMPEQKVVNVSGKFTSPKRNPQAPKRWELHISYNRSDRMHEKPGPPLLSQLCFEARAYILEKGEFIFKKEETQEGGLWWNPRKDILVFGKDFCPRFEPFALENLEGLQLVCHLGLDPEHAKHLVFEVQYGSKEQADEPVEQREVERVKFAFRGRAGVDGEYFPLKFFPHMQSVTVPCGRNTRYLGGHSCRIYHPDEECCIKLELGTEDVSDVKLQLRRYKDMWEREGDYDFFSHYTEEQLTRQGRSLVYYAQPGSDTKRDACFSFDYLDLALPRDNSFIEDPL